MIRETFQEMLDSIKTPFPECIQYLCEKITLDPYFKDFYHWSKDNGVPIVVLSSGMTPIIRALLSKLVGPEADEIEIICNEVVNRPGMTRDQEGGWTIQFHDESGFGHDKSRAIRPYAKHCADRPNEPHPTIFYAGDGVSDLSAARETDLLFAKKGRGMAFSSRPSSGGHVLNLLDLVTYCEREGVPFTVFEDWRSILATTKQILYASPSRSDSSCLMSHAASIDPSLLTSPQ